MKFWFEVVSIFFYFLFFLGVGFWSLSEMIVLFGGILVDPAGDLIKFCENSVIFGLIASI